MLEDRFNELLKREEIYWMQRSRLSQIKERDKNTAFFHVSTLNRRRKNIIVSKLHLKNSLMMKKRLLGLSTSISIRYSHPLIQSLSIKSSRCQTNQSQMKKKNEQLEAIPSVDEIKEALLSMAPLKPLDLMESLQCFIKSSGTLLEMIWLCQFNRHLGKAIYRRSSTKLILSLS